MIMTVTPAEQSKTAMEKMAVAAVTIPTATATAATATRPRPTTTPKQVRWSTVSVLEFRVGYNASAVPSSGGPPIGLVGRPARQSYSMIPDDEEDASDVETVASSDSEGMLDGEVSLDSAVSTKKRSSSDLWVCPMERARILAEENGFPLEDIALICSDVRATQDSRAGAQLDVIEGVDAKMAQDLRDLRRALPSVSREKVLLY